jgi:MFS family permease
LGGAFAERLSWRWAFYINLPVCALTFILLLIYLDVHNPRTRAVDGLKAIDWAGSVTMLAVTLMVLIGLNFGGTAFPWSSPKVIALLIVGSFMSLAFVVAEKKFARYPLIPLALFRDRSNLATLAVVFCHGMVFLGAEYYLPLYFQAAQLASPLRSGALVLPFVVSEALAGIATGVFMHQVGRYREPMWLGMTVLVAGFALFTTLGPLSSFATIVGFQVLAGAAAGLIFSPPIVAVQALMEQHDVAAATATLGFVRNVACAMSTVIGGVVFTNGIAEQKQRLMAVGLNATAVEAFSGRDAEANVLRIASIGDPRQRLAVQDAYAQSLRNCWIMYTCLAGVGVIASFFIRKAILSSEHVETKTGLRQKDEAENTRAERV